MKHHIITRKDIDRIRDAIEAVVVKENIALKDNFFSDLGGGDPRELIWAIRCLLGEEFGPSAFGSGINEYMNSTGDYSVKGIIRFVCACVREARIKNTVEAYKLVVDYKKEREIAA